MPQQNQQQPQQNQQQANGRNADTDVNSKEDFSSTQTSQGRGSTEKSSQQPSQKSSQQWSQQDTKEKGSGMNQPDQASRQAPGYERK